MNFVKDKYNGIQCRWSTLNYRTVIYVTEVRSHFVLSVVNNTGKYGGKERVQVSLGSEFNCAIIILLKHSKVNFSISFIKQIYCDYGARDNIYPI